ncbi:MAG: vanadium-dependent haloperoxidase, partial [Candidatus Sulfotelmatobacter sp.]
TALSQTNSSIKWNTIGVGAADDAKFGAPVTARALAIVNTCMYDAWAAYDERAVGTQLGGALRRPASERTLANKEQAVSYAAYRALADVLPVDTNSVYIPLMQRLGYDPSDDSTDIEKPAGIGNVACAAVLEFRHHDKSNQLGDLHQGSYSDWTNYRPVNSPGTVPARLPFAKPLNPEHWQPLTYIDSNGSIVLQMFDAPQWAYVAPFAMGKGDRFRSTVEPGPTRYGSVGYQQQSEELIAISAALTDQQKMISEFWNDGVDSVQPLQRWMQFAQFVSERDHHTLDDDVKLFFALSNAMFDASIATWDAKREYDSVRPVTAIPFLFRGKTIRAWGGPGKGTVEMDGSKWIPYQAASLPTPPSPAYVSEESAYSTAAARILGLWTGSDRFGHSVIMLAGSSKIEPGVTPARPITVRWTTFTEASEEAGMSGHYGGVNFRASDLAGHRLGYAVAFQVWTRSQAFFSGGPRKEP